MTASKPRSFSAFLRSIAAGGAATTVDIIVLFLGVHVLGLSHRMASLPALVAGGIVNFYANRHFAFRSTSGSLANQATLYTLTEIIALALNGVLYDMAVRTVHPTTAGALAIRLVTTHIVFVAWSFPVWKRVFRSAGEGRHSRV